MRARGEVCDVEMSVSYRQTVWLLGRLPEAGGQ